MEKYIEIDKGKIKLFCGDCLKLIKNIKDNSIDLIVTDPPYKMTSRGNKSNSGGMLQETITRKGLVFEYNDCDITEWAPELFRVLKNGGHAYIMTNHKNLIHFLNTATNCGFHFIKSLIWDKKSKIMGTYYMNQFEYILFFRKGEGKKINNCGTSDIISIANKKTKDENNKNIHNTEKPIELLKILIENSSKENEIILDPFMGSGSTALASKELKRQFIGYEIDEKYFKAILKRFNEIKEKDKKMLF